MAQAIASEETAHEVIDELLPEEFDWERLVRSYPAPALALAAAGGFWLGWNRGSTVASAIAGFAATRLTSQVNELLGDDVL